MSASHETYRQILESMLDGVYILDQELLVQYLNPSMVLMLKRFGLSPEIVGRKFTEVFSEATPYLQNEIKKVYDTKQPLHAEHVADLGTSTISYETARIPMFDSCGKITGVLNVIHDITSVLAIQNELKESRRIFEIMVDNANSIVLRMDLNGNVTYFNHFAEQFFGFTREEILNRSVQDTIIPKTDSEGVSLKDLISKIVKDPASYASNENENVKKDGTRVWISWSNKPVADKDGVVREILAVGNDITALKNAQRELMAYRHHLEELVLQQTTDLRESEARYRFLFEDSPTLSVIVGPDGKILDINKAMAQSLGYERGEMIGKNSFDFFVPEQKEKAADQNRQRILGDSLVNIENRVKAKDGSIHINLTTGHQQIRQGDRVVGVLLCGIDITEKKKMEETQRRQQEELARTDKLASLGTLVSGIAHEINNPNNFITLNADNLLDIWKDILPVLDDKSKENPDFKIVGLPYSVLREEMEHLIGGIRSGSRRIRTIVTHLKDFARQGPVDMEQEVDLRKVIDAAQVIIANTIKKSTNCFESTVAPDLLNVKGDFQKLEQVVINLLTNACQALTSREQAVRVDLSKNPDGTSVVLMVHDEGRGIEAEYLPYIFDPFFTTKRENGGTGLGLSISYGIIKDHKGIMEVFSEPGKGSRFKVTLPVYKK